MTFGIVSLRAVRGSPRHPKGEKQRLAIFHLSVKTVSRSEGRSAVAAVAYRSGERVEDERTGVIHDYTRRRGVEHTEMILPTTAPEWATGRGALWNAAERAETRKNATVAREFEVALPSELDAGQRLALVRAFAGELVAQHGLAVDVAIHQPSKAGDERNHHAHLLCSTRRLTAEGFGEKTRELDTKGSGMVGQWRERWAILVNQALEKVGRQERVDHRSLKAQGIEREATVHLGPSATAMERRGEATERGQVNAEVFSFEAARRRLREEKASLEAQGLALFESQAELKRLQEREDQERVKAALAAERAKVALAEQDPSQVKSAWAKEYSKYEVIIKEKAERIIEKARIQKRKNDKEWTKHEDNKPTPPKLFASLRQASFYNTMQNWESINRNFISRFNQINERIKKVSTYLSDIKMYNNTPGLIYKAIAKNNPILYEKMQKILKTEEEKRQDLANTRGDLVNKPPSHRPGRGR